MPLVTRRFCRLACSPQLLDEIEVEMRDVDAATVLSRLRSLVDYLGRRGGGSVRRLRLDLVEADTHGKAPGELSALLAGACLACRGLEEATLDVQSITLSPWLTPLGAWVTTGDRWVTTTMTPARRLRCRAARGWGGWSCCRRRASVWLPACRP